MTQTPRVKSRRRLLGPLEMALLDQLWELGALDVSAMHAAVGTRRGLSRNTIQSTLERLVRKELAVRRRGGRAYEYRAVISREEWTTDAISGLLDSIPGTDPALLLASFVDLAERMDGSSLESLEDLVGKRRRARSEES